MKDFVILADCTCDVSTEIAAEIGISRQGVRDIIKKSEEELFFYEHKLGLAKKMKSTEEHTKKLIELAEKLELPREFTAELHTLTEIISE